MALLDHLPEIEPSDAFSARLERRLDEQDARAAGVITGRSAAAVVADWIAAAVESLRTAGPRPVLVGAAAVAVLAVVAAWTVRGALFGPGGGPPVAARRAAPPPVTEVAEREAAVYRIPTRSGEIRLDAVHDGEADATEYLLPRVAARPVSQGRRHPLEFLNGHEGIEDRTGRTGGIFTMDDPESRLPAYGPPEPPPDAGWFTVTPEPDASARTVLVTF
jgi:hypothetical protein